MISAPSQRTGSAIGSPAGRSHRRSHRSSRSRLCRRVAHLLALAEDHGDGGVDQHVLGAGGDQQLADGAFIDGLDFHRCLVGLDFGHDVARGDLVTHLD